MSEQLFADLIKVANRYGESEYSRAGGGNASVKIDGVLHIKPSGVPLLSLTTADLVPLALTPLLDALVSDDAVEGDPVVAAATAALLPSYTGGRRPSVEILFHALIDDPLVLHLHPLTANALTCNADAVALAEMLLGDDAIVVDYIDPGVPLAREIAAVRDAYTARTGKPAPKITLLRNHGIIVSGDTADEISAHVATVTDAVRAAIDAVPAPTAPAADEPGTRRLIDAIAPTLRGLLGGEHHLAVVTSAATELIRAETGPDSAMLAGGPLIPDQIVYAGSLPCVVTVDDLAEAGDTAAAAVADYKAAYGKAPVIVVVPHTVVFAAGKDKAAADNALAVFTDSLRVTRDANRLGTVQVMTPAQRGFIETWEAEAYRQKVAAGGAAGRLTGKIAYVTGAAQGFGLGITESLLAEGATVVLADLNLDGASAQAERLSAQHGAGRAIAVGVDVSNPDSQVDAIHEVVRRLGGLDVFISNAGVLRADGVMTQSVADFDFVTNINYRGYFLGVRAVAPVLAAQHAARPDRLFDIIEINSKSGLEGSKRNFAYSGSKFGGIGLTQSFALELIEYGIKVNAVCPGNFLDGPLWSDPERGLFVQYLRAGKVEGATTVDDVRHFYEAKVPIGRGCLPSDVARAVTYVIEQQYETGQAVPVTGGQNMLN
jgi:NAD(P)-dependent dehydrogenase (short-subunit alcohol dehydrogenase family)/rhamnose utilization protein RhaD (predicted bifunctional aldolase and dehydrogenase)